VLVCPRGTLGLEVAIVWDVIKHAIEDTGRTVRFIAILLALAAVTRLLWR